MKWITVFRLLITKVYCEFVGSAIVAAGEVPRAIQPSSGAARQGTRGTEDTAHDYHACCAVRELQVSSEVLNVSSFFSNSLLNVINII